MLMPRPLRCAVCLVALGGTFVIVCNAVVLAGGRGWVDRAADAPASEAGLVLGAGLTADGRPSPMLADRIAAGAALYRAGRVPRMIVSGDHGTKAYDEVEAMRAGLVAAGVPDRVIFTDHAGFATLDSVVRARRIFGARKVVIVTQRFHLPRALWLARRAGLEASGLAADDRAYGRPGRNAKLREIAARVKAVLDEATGATPRFLGPRIDLHGDPGPSRG